MLSEYHCIKSHGVFFIEYEEHADLLTIISMTIAYNRIISYLPMHDAFFVKMLHS